MSSIDIFLAVFLAISLSANVFTIWLFYKFAIRKIILDKVPHLKDESAIATVWETMDQKKEEVLPAEDQGQSVDLLNAMDSPEAIREIHDQITS